MAAAIAAAVWAYGTRYPVLPSRRRALLLWTRLLTVGALIAASLAPVVRYASAGKERNRLLVLVDHSGSMEVRDAPGGRSRRQASDSVAAALAAELRGRYDVRVAPFDASLGSFARDGASLAAKGAADGAPAGETALGDALREATRRMDPDSVAALLIVSDGAVNRGEDPERALDASLPAFALVVGSASNPPTVGIAGVEAPGEAVAGKPTTLHVTIRQGDRPPARGVARLFENGRELGRAPFALESPGAAARVAVTFRPIERGKRFLWVTLDEIANDPMRENKRRLIAIDVRAARRRMPLLAASWDWDLRSLARGVDADTAWSVERLTPAGGGAVAPLGGAPAPLASLLDGAAAVAARYDSRVITPERAAALLRYVERGGGLLLWTDPQGRLPPETPLSRSLGLSWRAWGGDRGVIAATELAPAGRTHEVTLLGGDAASAAATWRDLPPVRPVLALGALGAGAGRLAPILLGRVGEETVPLLLAGRIGAGRVAVLNAAGVYRWGLTASGLGGGAGVEVAFFGGLCRWLAAGDDDRPVRIAAPDITPDGRLIAVRLTTASPAGAGARAVVRARRLGGTSTGSTQGGPRRGAAAAETTLAATAADAFAGSLSVPSGTYQLTGLVERGGREIGRDSVRVAVGAQGIEFESLAAEPGILARLADRSGGASAPLAAPEPVLRRLRSPDLSRARLAEMDLFHNPLLFTVLVLGLAVEWTLRRRFHLL